MSDLEQPSIHCPLYTGHFPVYSEQCPLYTGQCPVYSVHCTLSTVQCTGLTLFPRHWASLYPGQTRSKPLLPAAEFINSKLTAKVRLLPPASFLLIELIRLLNLAKAQLKSVQSVLGSIISILLHAPLKQRICGGLYLYNVIEQPYS